MAKGVSIPEGDTIYQAAGAVREALVRQPVEDLWGSARELRPWADRLRGGTVTEVFSRGKHLVVVFDDRFSLRTHMGMTGSWRVFEPGTSWSKSRGKARVVLETPRAVAVCFAAPDTQIGTTAQIEEELSRLGPDLLGDDFASGVAVQRSFESSAESVGELLLDQTVMAGVGNVYKSEILFLERLHPQMAAIELDREQRERLVDRARRLLLANRDRRSRSTTGVSRRGHELFVYGRSRRPCRRCQTPITSAETGSPARITYWCPRCQPDAGA